MQMQLNADCFSQPVGVANEQAQPLMMHLNELINHQPQQSAYVPVNGNHVVNQQVERPSNDWRAQVEAHTRSDLLAVLAGHAVSHCHSAHVFNSARLVSPKGEGMV